jgi:hypothetical protein
MRWLPESGPGRAITVTQIIAGLCTAVDLTMIGLFLASAIPMHPLAAVAVAASIIRIACGVSVFRRTVLIRCAATGNDDRRG